MLRALTISLLIMALHATAPALAWEASFGPICELTHDGEAAQVRVTYDPAIPEYAIEITPDRPWTPWPIFSMRFDGPRALTISTTRHVISGGGATLTVRDQGFGNVLDGLEFNETAHALLGERAVAIPLNGAAPAVRAFRDCTMGQSV